MQLPLVNVRKRTEKGYTFFFLVVYLLFFSVLLRNFATFYRRKLSKERDVISHHLDSLSFMNRQILFIFVCRCCDYRIRKKKNRNLRCRGLILHPHTVKVFVLLFLLLLFFMYKCITSIILRLHNGIFSFLTPDCMEKDA